MLTTKKCLHCGETKPWDDDPALKWAKASGFYGARCWGCYREVHRVNNNVCRSKLVTCSITREEVRRSTAEGRKASAKMVKCAATGEVVRYYTARYRQRKQDPFNRLIDNIRSLIRQAFYNKGYTKDARSEEILDCSFAELKQHLEDQFRPGMTWDNRGTVWHVDHHLPLSAATSLEEIVALSHYTNLVPLWKSENLSKGGKCDMDEVRAYLDLVKRGA